MHATRALADCACDFGTANLSDDTREVAVRCVLDLISAVLAAHPLVSVRAMRHAAREAYGLGVAPVWFSGVALTSVGAAFCNSAAACALDLDDGNRLARGHPGAAVIPAALAVAAEIGTGADVLLAAIVIGYEIGVRVGAARRFHSRSGMWCGYGAAAAAGWLRRMPAEQLSHALAIAGMTAPNVLSTSGGPLYPVPLGSDVKEGIPWLTASAVAAVQLAQSGVAGPLDLLDHAPHYDSSRLVDGFGARPAIGQTYFKPYA